jgi:hypothetical protein
VTGRIVPICVAVASMPGLRSVATIDVDAGRLADRARVTTPVPAAISSTRAGRRRATRRARSSA